MYELAGLKYPPTNISPGVHTGRIPNRNEHVLLGFASVGARGKCETISKLRSISAKVNTLWESNIVV